VITQRHFCVFSSELFPCKHSLNRSANPVLFTKQSSVKWSEQMANVLPHQLERH